MVFWSWLTPGVAVLPALLGQTAVIIIIIALLHRFIITPNQKIRLRQIPSNLPNSPQKKTHKTSLNQQLVRTSPAKRLAKAIPLVNCLAISQTCKGRPWSKTIGPLPAAPPAKRGRKTKPMTLTKGGGVRSLGGALGQGTIGYPWYLAGVL